MAEEFKAKDLVDPSKIETYLESVVRDVWNFPLITIDGNSITLATVTIGIVLLILGVLFAKYLSRKISKRILVKTSLDTSMRHTLETVFFYVFVLLFSLFAMRMANLPITIFTVLGGAIAIGVGFGSQNIVNNFISGLILMVERPVKVGDFIEFEKTFGHVEHIGMRSAIIKSYGNKHFIIPNSSFLEQTFVNWTLQSDNLVSLKVNVGVAYGSPTEKVRDLLTKATLMDSRVLNSKEPVVLFQDFGDSALIFEVYFWIRLREIMDIIAVKSTIRFNIEQQFRENGIRIPFPQRDVHLIKE